MHATRMITVGLVAALLVCAAPSWAQQAWEAASKEAVVKADWRKVVEAAQQWGQHETTPGIADWLLGYAGLATGDYRRALDGFLRLGTPHAPDRLLAWAEALSTQHPRHATVQMLRGDALARAGKYEEALVVLDEAVRLDSHAVLLYDTRGVVRMLAGKAEAALGDFETALTLEPRFANAHANAGLVRLQAGNPAGAVESLTQALELAPDFALAYNARGVAYALMEAGDEAEQDFRKAAELAPGLSYAHGNVQFLRWTQAQTALRQGLLDGAGEGRGATLIAQSYDHRVMDGGGGRTVDVFVIKATPQTRTLTGMRGVVQEITQRLRIENGLPDTWQPRLHLDAHGWRSTPIAQMPYAATLAQQAGRDAAIALDLSPWYTGRKTLTWHGNVTEAAAQTARATAAINLVTGVKPTFTGHSGGAEVIPRLGEMMARGDLAPEVAKHVSFSHVVLTAYPFQQWIGNDVAVPPVLLRRIDGTVYNLHTTPGHWSNTLAPQEKVVNILVTDSRGSGIWHGDFNAVRLPDGRANPILQIGGAALRGWEPATVQHFADQLGRRGEVPTYSLAMQQPLQGTLAMATLIERGLRPGDKVLIGTLDREHATVLMRSFHAGGWPVDWKPVTHPAELQNLAKHGGYTRILLDTSGARDPLSTSLLRDVQTMPAAPLPSFRALAQNLDRFNQSVGLVYKLADQPMPPELKVPLTFAGPILQDLQAVRVGQFHPWTAQTLERVGQFGLKELPGIANRLVQEGKLPASYTNLTPVLAGLPDVAAAGASQVGRGQLRPTVEELTHYLDGVNKTSWAIVGSLVGGLKGASVASTAAGLAADVVRGATEPLFQHWAHTPVRQQALQNWRAQVDTATAYRLPVKMFSEMYPPQYLKQIGFDAKTVGDLDTLARWTHAATHPATGSASQPLDQLQKPIAGGIPPLLDDRWRKAIFLPPHRFDAVPVLNYRLPSTDLLSDKRSGVKMKTEVVKGAPADTSGLFGSGARAHPPGTSSQDGLLAPFLLFCALPATS